MTMLIHPPGLDLSEITDLIDERLEDVKQSVRANELPRNPDNLQCFHPAFIGGL